MKKLIIIIILLGFVILFLSCKKCRTCTQTTKTSSLTGGNGGGIDTKVTTFEACGKQLKEIDGTDVTHITQPAWGGYQTSTEIITHCQ